MASAEQEQHDFSLRDEAIWELDKAKAEESADWSMRRFLAAQVYASLAIVEQVERLNDQLEQVIENGALKVRNA